MNRYFAFIFALFILSCNSNDQKASIPEAKLGPIAKSANSSVFNRSFSEVLANYCQIKDLFVKENLTEMDHASKLLLISVDSLPFADLKADTNIIATAQSYRLGISSEIKGLLGEKGLESKRKAFQMISDQLYDLIRIIQYDGAVIYHFYCAAAFDGQGAYWLNDTKENSNPYIPKEKPSCATVKDSIFFNPLIK